MPLTSIRRTLDGLEFTCAICSEVYDIGHYIAGVMGKRDVCEFCYDDRTMSGDMKGDWDAP